MTTSRESASNARGRVRTSRRNVCQAMYAKEAGASKHLGLARAILSRLLQRDAAMQTSGTKRGKR